MTGQLRYVPIVNGVRDQFVRYTLPQAASRLAAAHQRGQRWDCRVATAGEGYRPLTAPEGRVLVQAITASLRSRPNL